ncbi:MAG: PEGA domain-containing protein, partial [Candidatus Omnitrophica bacterium]|nr:PEGA domain-containing protein [Candidatus Omnitrophota bacterium]
MMLFRKILFYCFLLIYFTLCPFLIFYTLGYRFDLHGDRGIVKTGALSITTLPEGAAVSLGNRRPSHKTPAVILNLRVGPYDVRIEKEGYQPWFNQVSIEAEKAVVAEKIILLPLELKPELIAPGPFKKIALFKEGTLAVILRGSQLSELMVLDLVKNTEYVLNEGALSQFQSSQVGAVYTVPASSVFWVWLEDSGGRMLRVRVRLGVLEAEDWSRYILGKPDELQWDPGVENKLYAFRDKALSVINLDRGTSYAAGHDLQGFKISKQRIFMSRSQGVVRMDSD